jgi:hypothetical protein
LLGKTRIGRNRLPPGMRAHLDDETLQRAAIRDLYRYAMQVTAAIRSFHAVAFRVVDRIECDAINNKLKAIFPIESFASSSAEFCPDVGFLHTIDNEHIAHAMKRHGDEPSEREHGHLPITSSDVELVPMLVQPRHIIGFKMTGESPRVIYAREVDDAILVAVEELRRARRVMGFKTLYKQKKKAAGDIRLASDS